MQKLLKLQPNRLSTFYLHRGQSHSLICNQYFSFLTVSNSQVYSNDDSSLSFNPFYSGEQFKIYGLNNYASDTYFVVVVFVCQLQGLP